MTRHPGRSLALALSACLLSACGSTVAMTGGSAPDNAGLDGTSVTTGAETGRGSSSSEPSAGSLPSTAGTGDTGGATAPVGTGSGTTSQPSVPGAGTSGPVTHGTSTTPVQIGYLVAKDTGAAFSALGYGGLSSGNGTTQARAAVELVNAHGGLGGHPIAPVIVEADATASESSIAASACATFFQDNHVKAVVGGSYIAQLSACAQKQGVPYLADGPRSTSNSAFAGNPLLAIPNQLTIERAATALPAGLVRSGWITVAKKPVIGLVTYDTPDYKNVEPLVTAELKKAGLKLTSTTYMPYNDVGAASSAGRSAALKFASLGIDHVIGVDSGFAMSWFTLSAGQQSYYPKLGLSSLSIPGSFPTLFTPRQLNGAAGIGWSPSLDNSVPDQKPVSPRGAACLAAVKAKGEDTSAEVLVIQALSICDATYLLADTLASGTITGAEFERGIAGLSSFQSANVFKANPSRSRAAAAAYRPLAYQAGCQCFRYSGAVQAISSS